MISRIHTIVILLVCLAFTTPLFGTEYFVAKTGSDDNAGSAEAPFQTIGRAAREAAPGDIITIRRGVYREHVNPPRGGSSDILRIVYRAAPGEEVIISGSEPVSGWELQGELWRLALDDAFFGAFNPFKTSIRNPGTIPPVADDPNAEWGWLMYGRHTHRGDIYLNGIGLTERESVTSLDQPMSWYAEPSDSGVVLWANFGDTDPNANMVEVNVREHGFFPTTPGLGWISLRGLTVMNIASSWAPPILPQPGAIGVNGGHHWVIEDNVVVHGKTVCISVGNPFGPADEKASGHHVIRNNVLRRCGQAGIAGEAWQHDSVIAGNLVEDINYRDEFGGYETAGIKLHRTTGTTIENNLVRRIHARPGFSGHGIWLDYQNRHVMVSNNVVYDISAISIYLEANWDGPIVLQNNVVFGQPDKEGRDDLVMSASSRGDAWIHNLLVQMSARWIDQDYGQRPPVNHVRWFNNVMVGSGLDGVPERSDIQMDFNLMLAGAQASPSGSNSRVLKADPGFALVEDQQGVRLHYQWPGSTGMVPVVGLQKLDLPLRRPDGSWPDISKDFNGMERAGETAFGPFSDVEAGAQDRLLFEYPQAFRPRSRP